MREKNIHRVFVISLLIKGLDSLLEIAGGIMFLFTGSVTSLIISLTRGELLENPTDMVANGMRNLIPYFSGHTQLFWAAYLLIHGVVKIFLVAGLLKKKLWVYPTAIVVLFLFIAYQIYRYSYTHSAFLILLSLFDLLIIWLTWHEYNFYKKHPRFAEHAS